MQRRIFLETGGSVALGLALLIPLAAPASAQHVIGARDGLTAQVDLIFRAFDRNDSPGCAVGILRAGELVYARGYGMANLEHMVPITPSTIFGLASVSKQFTAAAVALLAQQNRLSLDDEVRIHIPELPDLGNRITLRHLIHHTSGLRLFRGGSARDELLDAVSRISRSNFLPGERYQYSNLGYQLLAVVSERASGKSLQELARAEIFEPLGMKSTFFVQDAGAIIPNLAYEYFPAGDRGLLRISDGEPGVTTVAGAGGLYSTIEDLARWDRNFYLDRVGRPGLVTLLHDRGRLNSGERMTYAFGMEIEEYRGLRTVRHGGEGYGYRTALVRFPDQRFSVAVLCNGGDAVGDGGPLADRVVDVYLKHEFREAVATQTAANQPIDEEIVQLSHQDLISRVGLFWNPELNRRHRISFQDGKLWLTMLDAPMGGQLGPLELEALGPRRFRRVGNPASEWRFEETVAGTPNRVIVTRRVPPGRGLTFVAIQEWSPSRDEMAEYAGLYLGDESDVLFRVAVEGDSLILNPQGSGRRVLVPLFPDAFNATYPSGTPYHLTGRLRLEFRRDATGRVSGVTFTNNRGDFRFSRAGPPRPSHRP